uniref:Ig-like domain-containing protein n=1 Tax=Denticeps clupeoides TaxID=299321 RepID=A0A8C4CGI5_9TELE
MHISHSFSCQSLYQDTRMTSKSDNPAAAGKLAIKKRSKVPGVMITQFVENLPQGMSTPDFTRKPIALTIQEGKTAIFRSIVTGNPSPNVTWTRSKGDLSDGDRFKIIYETISDVGVDQAGTYKCFAENEYGKAVVTATLNIIEVGFKKGKALQEGERQKEDRLPGEPDEHFWELLLSADRKDYERICAEYGVTDFRWMLKKLNEKKREREEEQAQFVEHLSNLKPIEIKTPGCAEFEFEMELKDQNSRIFLYKVQKSLFALNHSLKQIGRKFVFSVKDLDPEDAGLYQVDVEGVNVFSTDFKIPSVDFLVKIQEVKAIEREDAVFECVLSNPMPQITWLGKNVPLQQGEKHDITVSEDKLIHRLVVKDCLQLDKGIYTAVVGIKSCNAWLVVEGETTTARGKEKEEKFILTLPESKNCKFEAAPSFLLPLKKHSNPPGYECYMSCAVKGDPAPHITWYRDNVSLNTNTNYYISNTCGVCSLLILRVGPKDTGEYKVVAESPLGRAECSTTLTVRGKHAHMIYL